MRRATVAITALIATLAIIGSSPALAAAGDLDPTFGTGGKTITSAAQGFASIRDIAVQENDRIVAAGARNGAFTVMRYTAMGELDPTFSDDGIATASFSEEDSAYGVAIQPDGKIVAVGTMAFGEAVAIARFTSGGALDATFSGNGKARTRAGFAGEDVGIQSDGAIVVMGSGYDRAREKVDFLALRYGSDGTRDLSFGDDGVTRVSFGPTTVGDQAYGGALDPQDRIYLVGSAFGRDFGIARLLPDGERDQDFGANGKVTTTFGDGAALALDIAIQADGRPVAVGYVNFNQGFDTTMAIARYRLGGSLDPTFSRNGKTTTSFTRDSIASGVTIDANGRIIVCGDITYRWAITRYRSDGSLDLSFSGNGRVATNFTNDIDRAYAVTTQDGGRIVVGGMAGLDAALAGYMAE
jgi:uncharacterized delta-60 repeat protein